MRRNRGDRVAEKIWLRRCIVGMVFWRRRAYPTALLVGVLAIVVVLATALWPSAGASRQAASLPGLHLGGPVPDFTLSDPQGHPVHLAALRGHVVLINFWSPTCPPCVTEMPLLQRAAQEARTRGDGRSTPLVLGIEGTPDSAAQVAAFGRRVGAHYPLLLDSLLRVTYDEYHVGVLPTSIVIDPAGRLRSVHLGPLDLAAMRHALGIA